LAGQAAGGASVQGTGQRQRASLKAAKQGLVASCQESEDLNPRRKKELAIRPLIRSFAVVALLVVGLVRSDESRACPFCSAPGRTLSEQLQQSDAALVVRFVGRMPPDASGRPVRTTYEIVRDLHGSDSQFLEGDILTLGRLDKADEGAGRILLLSSKTIPGDWAPSVPISEAGIDYLLNLPAPEVKPTERLTYFARFLESRDPLIAQDAFGEFANADYRHITAIARTIDSAKVRGWIADPKTDSSRLALYGLLLGLSGSAEDAEYLKKRILEPTDKFRLGSDGLISGYLLLTREEGLSVIEQSKLRDKACHESETYAAMQAVRFMWTYGEGTIGKDHLRAAMRILLDRPSLAELVIVDLGRWSDWSVLDRLMELYGTKGYDEAAVKRAIVRFCLVAEAARPKGPQTELPKHVAKAKAHLAALRKQDPEIVADAEEFFYLNF